MGFSAAALTVVLQSQAAAAQPQPCPMCRAPIPYGNCDPAAIERPPQGALGLIGRVSGIGPATCATRLTVDVIRSPKAPLPSQIKIDVRPCLHWPGKAGDEIRVLVHERPSQQTGAYQARACN